jgi:hypothetical protein
MENTTKGGTIVWEIAIRNATQTNKQPSSIDGYECDAIGNILGNTLGSWELYGNITKPLQIGACPTRK